MTDEKKVQEFKLFKNTPVLPLRNIVVFPHMVVPLFVGRDKSISALESVMDKGQELLFLAQKDADINDPQKKDLYEVGTLGKVLQLLKLPDGTVKVLVEGLKRARVEEFNESGDYLEAKIEVISEDKEFKSEVKVGFDIFENSKLSYSYSHISNNDWGDTNPGTDNQQITFSKNF